MIEDSKAYLRFTAKSKGKRMELIFSEQDSILFFDHAPIAVYTGGVCYYLDRKNPGAVTKAIHDYAKDSKMTIRAAASDFDFLVGSLLTKVGLPLTRRS